MTKVAAATRVWKTVRTSIHEDLAVADHAWLALRKRIVRADRLLRLENHRESRVRALVLRVGFRTSITPLPIHHEYLWGGNPAEAISEIRSYGIAAGLDAVVELGEYLGSMVDNRVESPLWTAFLKLRPSLKAPVVVGVRRQSALEHLEPRFANLTDVTRVLSLSELGGLEERKATIFFGPPSVYPSWVKLFPRSNTVWIRHAWNKQLVFPDAIIGMMTVAAPAETSRRIMEHPLSTADYDSEPDDYGEPDELATEMNRARLASELDKAANSETSTTVASRIGVLANDDYVLLPIEEGTMVTVFDPQLRSVRREQTRRLIPGMFVVVRERGSRDHLRSIAESKFLDNPQDIRDAMNKWKQALLRSIKERGIDRVANDLDRLGVEVGQSSIRLWTTDLIHGPGNFDNLKALFDYLGLEDAKAHWEHLLRVRRAGREAGTYMRRQLIEQASRVGAHQIQRESTLRFTLDGVDGGALIAVKVDEVLPEVIQAPVELVGQLIEGV